MGMFDYIRCKYPLPVDGVNDLEYQTKDTDSQFCDQYEIREDGTLWHQTYETEDRSDPEAEGLMALLGCMTRVNESWEPDEMTGEVRFYTARDDSRMRETWVEFSAYFVKGKLTHIETISTGLPGAAS